MNNINVDFFEEYQFFGEAEDRLSMTSLYSGINET